MKVNFAITLVKTSLLAPLFIALPLCQALLASVLVILLYPYLIALVFGVKVMPTTDLSTFFGSDKARVNIMSFTLTEKFSFEATKANIRRLVEKIPKSRYCIVEIFGDYYYKELPIE
jgi:hypothetical protein